MKFQQIIALSFVLVSLSACHYTRKDGESFVNEHYTVKDGSNFVIMTPVNAYKDSPVLGPIYFEYDTSVLTQEAKVVLESYYTWIKEEGISRLLLIGNTDEPGQASYNDELGLERANAVKDYLVSLGLDAAMLETTSVGNRHKIVKTNKRHWRNRRVEFVTSDNKQ